MLETRTITHGDPEKPSLQVTVSTATALMGMKRSVLISEAVSHLRAGRKDKDTGEEEVREGSRARLDLPTAPDELSGYFLRRFTWPNCIACAIASQGFDCGTLSFEEFGLMPEQFVSRWEEAALSLNPHWKIGTEEDTPEEKKDDSASEKI